MLLVSDLSVIFKRGLINLNPHPFRKVVSTVLEPNERANRETSEENWDILLYFYQDVEMWV
ncbi:MAG TPA: hypothetical protein VK184_02170 [Nostocaceae cyanobacterium]|nr:hypothetical protein [Nostocaceae cyanobacterium]